jgi:hypothetical protein
MHWYTYLAEGIDNNTPCAHFISHQLPDECLGCRKHSTNTVSPPPSKKTPSCHNPDTQTYLAEGIDNVCPLVQLISHAAAPGVVGERKTVTPLS